MSRFLSMFEADPAVIAAGLSAAQVAYLRARAAGLDAVRPHGTWCRTITSEGEITARGRGVLAVLDSEVAA